MAETSNTVDIPEDVRKMSFEEALSALEEIVRQLEARDVSLEDSIEIYTRGNQLRAHCEAKLRDASQRIEKITRQQNGALETAPLDVD